MEWVSYITKYVDKTQPITPQSHSHGSTVGSICFMRGEIDKDRMPHCSGGIRSMRFLHTRSPLMLPRDCNHQSISHLDSKRTPHSVRTRTLVLRCSPCGVRKYLSRSCCNLLQARSKAHAIGDCQPTAAGLECTLPFLITPARMLVRTPARSPLSCKIVWSSAGGFLNFLALPFRIQLGLSV